MQRFEKTLTGGFSCVNTRLGFDTESLLLNLTQSDYNKMNTNQSFQSFKKQYIKYKRKMKKSILIDE